MTETRDISLLGEPQGVCEGLSTVPHRRHDHCKNWHEIKGLQVTPDEAKRSLAEARRTYAQRHHAEICRLAGVTPEQAAELGYPIPEEANPDA